MICNISHKTPQIQNHVTGKVIFFQKISILLFDLLNILSNFTQDIE